jgi:senataxin
MIQLMCCRELRRIPAGQHWFCPSYEYLDDYEGEDEPPTSVIKNEDSTETDLAYRRKLVTDSLQIYAYDGEDVFPHQEYLKQQIDRHLGKCDLCIVQYYKARHGAMESLRG